MTKKTMVLVPIIGILLLVCFIVPLIHAENKALRSQLLAQGGKSYSGTETPDYIAYDQVLRTYMAERLRKEFGVALDPRTYSGFDLLEIRALLKFKKTDESFDDFLKMFPKHP